MKLRIAILLLFMFAIIRTCPAQQVNPAQLESFLKSHPEIGTASIVSFDSKSTDSFFYSSAGVRPHGESLHKLSSLGGLFGSMLLANQIARGMVSDDTYIEELFPHGITMTYDWSSMITLRHLATHASGLRYQGTERPVPGIRSKYEIMDELNSCNVRYYGEYNYSEFNIRLLAFLLSNGSGFRYEALLKKRILDPLGMMHTYSQAPEWYSTPVIGANDQVPANESTIYSTVNDLLIFMRSQLVPPGGKLSQSISLARSITQPFNDYSLTLGWKRTSKGTTDLFEYPHAEMKSSAYLSFDQITGKGIIILLDRPTNCIFEIKKLLTSQVSIGQKKTPLRSEVNP